MSFLIDKDEADAGRRTVGFRLFGSNGTSPATTFSTGTMLGSLNGAAQLSLGSASVVSANAGMYAFAFSQSNVSVLGSWDLFTDALVVFPQHVAKVQVVNNNPMSTLSALNISALTALGVVRLDSSVTLKAGVHSGATIKGIENYANISNVTLHAGVHSGATVQINSIAPGSYSAVSFSVRDGGIAAVSHQAGAIDAAAVAADAWEEAVDVHLGRSIQGGANGGRTVTSSHRMIRNRVTLSGLTGTVYEEDNSTSAFTFSLTTVDAVAINHIQPGGL